MHVLFSKEYYFGSTFYIESVYVLSLLTNRYSTFFFIDFRGRFSTVKKVSQNCTNREMAAKCIHKRITDIDHVETEYNTLQALQHENLIPVFDVYTTPTSYIIIMPL